MKIYRLKQDRFYLCVFDFYQHDLCMIISAIDNKRIDYSIYEILVLKNLRKFRFRTLSEFNSLFEEASL